MLNTIISAVTAYLSTNLDYLGFLMAFFAQSKAPKKYRYILIGNVIGIIILVSCSLILGLILHTVPAEWMLGLLGIIPLYFGCRLLFSNEEHSSWLNWLQTKQLRGSAYGYVMQCR